MYDYRHWNHDLVAQTDIICTYDKKMEIAPLDSSPSCLEKKYADGPKSSPESTVGTSVLGTPLKITNSFATVISNVTLNAYI